MGAAAKAIANVIGPRAVYRTPRPRRSPQRLPPVEGSVDAAIVEIAKTYPTDGYRMVCAFGRGSVVFWREGDSDSPIRARRAELRGAVRHFEQMDPERARELLRRERERIEHALAGLKVPGSDELASEGMADSASPAL